MTATMVTCDSETLGRLYRNESERLERQIARRIGNQGIARDLMHEVFLQLWQRAGELRGNPAAFLTRAARNVAIDHLRRETTRRTYIAGTAPPSSPQDPAFDALSAQETTQAIRIALDAMPETTRMLFLMNRAEGMSFQEIAMHCGMSERNVAKHMAKAVSCCARMLKEAGPA